MYDKNGDIVIQEVEEKLNKNIEVTKQDLVALKFTPIMSGKLTSHKTVTWFGANVEKNLPTLSINCGCRQSVDFSNIKNMEIEKIKE